MKQTNELRPRRRGRLLPTVGLVILVGCSWAEKALQKVVPHPKVVVGAVTIAQVSTQGVDLAIETVIHNPSPIEITVARVEYRFQVADEVLATGQGAKGVKVKAHGQTGAKTPVYLEYEKLLRIYQAQAGKADVPYVFSGKVVVASPLGELGVPFKDAGTFPMFMPLALEDFSLESKEAKLSGVELRLKAKLKNPNAFPVRVKQFEYTAILEGHTLSSGRAVVTPIPAGGESVVKIPVTINFLAGMVWAQALIQKREAEYAFDFNAIYVLDDRKIKQKEKVKGKLKF